jgi:hypothetical protein
MAIARITLHALGFPNVSPNCLIVLQKLCAEGFKIILKDVHYKDRDAIVDYFDRLNIPFSFSTSRDPEIDILNKRFRIYSKYYPWGQNRWDDIDKTMMKEEVYSRSDGFIPSYVPNTYFVVYNYGEKDQHIDSKPGVLGVVKQKATRCINEGKAQTATVVDANTLRIAGVSDSTGYEEFTDLVYFNSEL